MDLGQLKWQTGQHSFLFSFPRNDLTLIDIDIEVRRFLVVCACVFSAAFCYRAYYYRLVRYASSIGVNGTQSANHTLEYCSVPLPGWLLL